METNNKRPKVVQAPEGCEDYFTAGKNYEVVEFLSIYDKENGHCFTLISDVYGVDAWCKEKKCAHLNGGDWIIVETE